MSLTQSETRRIMEMPVPVENTESDLKQDEDGNASDEDRSDGDL